jgi:hypothetical protein
MLALLPRANRTHGLAMLGVSTLIAFVLGALVLDDPMGDALLPCRRFLCCSCASYPDDLGKRCIVSSILANAMFVMFVAAACLAFACGGGGDGNELRPTPEVAGQGLGSPETRPTLLLQPESGNCGGKVAVYGSGFAPTVGRPHDELTLQLLALPGRVPNRAQVEGAPSVMFLRLGVDSEGKFDAALELVDPAVVGTLCSEDAITVVAIDSDDPSQYAYAIYEIR